MVRLSAIAQQVSLYFSVGFSPYFLADPGVWHLSVQNTVNCVQGAVSFPDMVLNTCSLDSKTVHIIYFLLQQHLASVSKISVIFPAWE